MWCWGGNVDGEHPFGDPDANILPARNIEIEGSSGSFVELDLGTNFTCVRDSDDVIWCAGRNGAGQLGRASTDLVGTSFEPAIFD